MPPSLTAAVLEIERHVAAGGWDQRPRLFALARTTDLLAREPALAAALGPPAGQDGLTPIEQEPLPAGTDLDEVLAALAWPAEVTGCALALERIVLPPSAEADLPDGPGLAEAAADHPDRSDVRLVAAVLRDGTRMAAVRIRGHDQDADVLTGPDLVPRLCDALQATLRG